jgi:hypothetical protein
MTSLYKKLHPYNSAAGYLLKRVGQRDRYVEHLMRQKVKPACFPAPQAQRFAVVFTSNELWGHNSA